MKINTVVKRSVNVFIIVPEGYFNIPREYEIEKGYGVHKIVNKGIAKEFIEIENKCDTPATASLYGIAHWYFFFMKDFQGKSLI